MFDALCMTPIQLSATMAISHNVSERTAAATAVMPGLGAISANIKGYPRHVMAREGGPSSIQCMSNVTPSYQTARSMVTGSPACAGDDDRGVGVNQRLRACPGARVD